MVVSVCAWDTHQVSQGHADARAQGQNEPAATATNRAADEGIAILHELGSRI